MAVPRQKEVLALRSIHSETFIWAGARAIPQTSSPVTIRAEHFVGPKTWAAAAPCGVLLLLLREDVWWRAISRTCSRSVHSSWGHTRPGEMHSSSHCEKMEAFAGAGSFGTQIKTWSPFWRWLRILRITLILRNSPRGST